jgi:hypothetical protein
MGHKIYSKENQLHLESPPMESLWMNLCSEI